MPGLKMEMTLGCYPELRFLLMVLCLSQPFLSMEITTPAPPKCPEDCTCTDNMRVLSCTDFFDKKLDTRLASLTKELRLKRNYTGPIANSTFRGLAALETIDLSFSQVSYIQSGAFRGLTHLKRLNLQGNLLRLFDEHLFQENLNIEELDLSENYFMFLKDDPYRFLPNLKLLNISFNKLSSVNMGLRFQVPTRLQTIDFSGNPIEHILSDDFEPAKRWDTRIAKSFNFSKCGLKLIDTKALSDLKNIHFLGLGHNIDLEINNLTQFLTVMADVKLKVLDISYTNFTTKVNITDFNADNLGTLSIQGLNLAGNYINEIDDHLLTFMNIHWLDLSHNSLTSLTVGIANLIRLKYLDLSHNMISTICEEFQNNLVNMESLKLSNNKIGDQSNLNLAQALKLKYLDLSNNVLEMFIIPHQLEKLEKMYLSGNSIHSLNDGSSLTGLRNLVHFDVSENKLTQLNDFLFRDSRNIEYANFAGNLIASVNHQTFVPNCPNVLDLSRNKLQSVHHFGWDHIISINLHGNQIRNVQTQSFYFLEALSSLDLSNNAISELDKEVFSHLTNLSLLKLNDNKLSEDSEISELLAPVVNLEYIDISRNNFTQFDSLPLPFVHNFELKEIRMSSNHIRTMSEWVFSNLKHLEYVDFSRNPFHCECGVLALQRWCQTTSVVIGGKDNFGYICRSPKMRGGRTLMDFKVNTFECNGYLLHVVIFSSAGGGAMLLAVAIGTACCLWHRFRKRKEKGANSDQASLDLVRYKKLNKSAEKVLDPDQADDTILSLREKYLMNNPSDTLIDVEFEYPKLTNGTIPNGRKSIKNKSKSLSKESKSKSKKKVVAKKHRHKYLHLNGAVHDGKGVKFENGYCNHSRASLKKILATLDKEYLKKPEKKHSKHSKVELREKKKRPRGNKDLVRLVSMQGSRSMPNVLSYIESLPRHHYIKSDSQRYIRVPIHHVDHVDKNQGGWTTSLVDLPRIHRNGDVNSYRQLVEVPRIHRSTTAPISMIDMPRIHRSSKGAVSRVDHLVDVPRVHRSSKGAISRYDTYDASCSNRPHSKHRQIPDGYHTIASTRGRILVDSRVPWMDTKTLRKSSSTSNKEHLSQWL